MIAVRNLRLGTDEPETRLRSLAAKRLGIPERDIKELKILKRSLDARKKSDIHRLYSLALTVRDEKRVLAKSRGRDVAAYEPPRYEIPQVKCEKRPVIAGFGPAGMFAALVLSKAGARPLVLERGLAVEERVEKVEAFRAGGALDPECNVQFGEGGAGTFSDGKLNTGTKDPRISWVFEQFVKHGAPKEIEFDAKPHIGTDILVGVVRNIRKTVLSLGGEICFGAKLASIETKDGKLCAVTVESAQERRRIETDALILAVGHSARDTFKMLEKSGVPMQPKPFSMGVRIEHRQADIDRAQYGEQAKKLPAADYSLNVHLPDGTSAYTFWMCPGGEVIAAASEPGGIATNGMSRSKRDGENANAALLVTLKTEDFPYPGALGGMYWQQEIERRAFEVSGSYRAPAQTVRDFLNHEPSGGAGGVEPSYKPGVHWCELHSVLPERISSVIENALPELGKRLRGFGAPDAVLTAPETRSSSPVRILRDSGCMSAVCGLYPCGEGAGYAGGITSAAVDGMRCAEALMKDHLAKND